MPVGVVRMSGTKGARDGGIILAARVLVADQQRNGRTGGFAFVEPGQNFDLIRLLALGHVPRRARTAPVQLFLNVGLGQCHAGRTAINHAADGRTMRLTKVGDTKKLPKCAASHNVPDSVYKKKPIIASAATSWGVFGNQRSTSRWSPGQSRM